MEFILKRPNGYRIFQSEWKDKWALAIIKYSKTLKKKEIKEVLAQSEESTDDEGID